MSEPLALLVDLDSTLCDTRHRWPLSPIDPATGQWLLPEPERRAAWQRYSMACPGDTLIPAVRDLMRSWRALGNRVHIVSGRDACAEPHTRAWLDSHTVPYDGIHLHQPGGDWTDHKVATIARLREAGERPVLFVDDWPPIAERVPDKTGVPVVLVTPPYTDADILWPTYAM